MIFDRLLGRKASPGPVTPSLPAGQRIYAIGDVHGRADLLDQLLALIDRDIAARPPSNTRIIFLGDLVDRGADSCRVIERVMNLAQLDPSIDLLLGNHEEVFLHALKGDMQALRLLIRMGGKETILSYGIGDEEYEAADLHELSEIFIAAVPQSHIDFLSTGRDQVELGDYLFVHRAFAPASPLPINAHRTCDGFGRNF